MSSKRTSVNPLAGFLKPQPQLQPSAITSSSSSAQAAFTGGLSNSKINSRQGPPEVPSNSKINPQTPSRTKIENLIKYFNVWSQSGREHRYVYRWHSVWRPCPRDAVFLVWSCPGSNPEHALAQTPICLKSI